MKFSRLTMQVLLAVLCVVFHVPSSVLAVPFYEPYTPTIGPGFTPRQEAQLKDAFQDALTLALTPLKAPADITDPIYKSYFPDTDLARRTVICKLAFQQTAFYIRSR